jgi:hypothetical protein
MAAQQLPESPHRRLARLVHLPDIVRQRLTLHTAGACALCVTFIACGDTKVAELIGPDVVRCQISIAPPPAPVPAAGTDIALTVAAARDCVWTATSGSAGIQVSPTAGQGSGDLTLTVEQNGVVASRTGTVHLNETSVVVVQEPAPCRFELSRVIASALRTPAKIGRPRRGGVTIATTNQGQPCRWARFAANQLPVRTAAKRSPSDPHGIDTLDVVGGRGRRDQQVAAISFPTLRASRRRCVPTCCVRDATVPARLV